MEPHIVHRSLVTRQFVQQLARTRLPDRHTPISAACCNLLAVRTPSRLDQVLLHARRRTVVCPHMSVRRRKGSDVPRPHSRVVGVGEKVLRIGRDLERGDCVGVAHEGVCYGFLADVPDFDVVVYAACIEFVAGFGEGDCGDRELGFDVVDRFFCACVPELSRSLVKNRVEPEPLTPIEPSSEPLRRNSSPRLLKSIVLITSSCPLYLRNRTPVSTSHIARFLSAEAENSNLESRDQ